MVQRSSFRKKNDPTFKLVSRGVSIKREPVFLGGQGPTLPEKPYSVPIEMIALSGWNGTVVAAAGVHPSGSTMSGTFEMVRVITLQRHTTPGIEVLYGRFDDAAATGWLFSTTSTTVGFAVYSVSGAASATIPVASLEIGKVYILFGMYYPSGGIQVAELYRYASGSSETLFVSKAIAAATGSDGGYKANTGAEVKTTIGNKIDGTIPCPSFSIINAGGVDGVTWTTTMMNQIGNDIVSDYKLNVIPLDYIPEPGVFVPREIFDAVNLSGSQYVWPDWTGNYVPLTFTGSVSGSVAKVGFVPIFG